MSWENGRDLHELLGKDEGRQHPWLEQRGQVSANQEQSTGRPLHVYATHL